MPKVTFEPQDFYQEAVYDTRVTSLLSELALAEALSPETTRKRWDMPFVHTVKLIDSPGLDGEFSSGAVYLLDIAATDGRQLAAIRSWQAENNTGMPIADCSWSAEFDDMKAAKAFWRTWRKKFSSDYFREDIQEYARNHPGTFSNETVRLQPLGLLNPWYEQKQGDQPLLDIFATVGTQLACLPRQAQAADFTPGQVYKVPDRPWYTTKVSSWAAKTCLAAFVMKPERVYGYTDRNPDVTHIQWSDGQLSAFPHYPSETMPQPLTGRDIARRPRTVAS